MNTVEKNLADLIRAHPNLYDPSRRDYKDAVKGHLSWREIADAMAKSEDEVKLKWKNLRDKFCKAKKRMAKRSVPLPPPPPPEDKENPADRPVPVLYGQLSWLSAYVKPRPGPGPGPGDPEDPTETFVAPASLRIRVPGSGDDPEKEADTDKKEQHCPLPAISTGFPQAESRSANGQDLKRAPAALKRKRQTAAETDTSSADAPNSLRDEDEMFLLSLLPSLKRLTNKKRMEVRMKFQQVLYTAEFED